MDSSHLILAAALLAATCGCQAIATPALPNPVASREQKKIAKLAANDPFPSPADVGLEAATKK